MLKFLQDEIKELDNQISDMESGRLDLQQEIQNLKKDILERDEKIENLNAENERLSISLEGIRSSYDLQGLVNSAILKCFVFVNCTYLIFHIISTIDFMPICFDK